MSYKFDGVLYGGRQAQIILEDHSETSFRELASQIIDWVSIHSWRQPKIFDLSLQSSQTYHLASYRRLLITKRLENKEATFHNFGIGSSKTFSRMEKWYLDLSLQQDHKMDQQYYKCNCFFIGLSSNLNRRNQLLICSKQADFDNIPSLLYLSNKRCQEMQQIQQMQLQLNSCQNFWVSSNQGYHQQNSIITDRCCSVKFEADCVLGTQIFGFQKPIKQLNLGGGLFKNKQPEMLLLTLNAYLQTGEHELSASMLEAMKSVKLKYGSQEQNEYKKDYRKTLRKNKLALLRKNSLLEDDWSLNRRESVEISNVTSRNKHFQQIIPAQLKQPFDYHQKEAQNPNQLPQQFQLQRINHSQCIGCSPYFICKKPIYQRTATSIPLRSFDSILRLKKNQVQFKDAICSMLNSGGGIILFDCETVQQNIYAKGEYLTEKHKEDIEQSISSYFRWIIPRVEINSNIKISFVPILADGSCTEANRERMQGFGDNQKLKKQDFKEGRYVTRLRVAPTDGISVYSWFYSSKQAKQNSKETITSLFCSILDHEDNSRALKFGEARRLIKKKFKQNYLPPHFDGLASLLLQQPINIFGHQCDDPQKGYPVMKEAIKPQAKNMTFEFQKPSQLTLANFSQQYPNMTFITIKKDDLPRIKQQLSEAGIQCEVENRFSKYKFKYANNSAILHHKAPFALVHSVIANDPRCRFSNGKPYIVLNVTDYLKLQLRDEHNGLDSASISRYTKQLQSYSEEESAKFFQYQVGPKKVEYYLSTSSKLGLLFMYLLLNHLGEKVSLKNPPNLQKGSLSCKGACLKAISAVTKTELAEFTNDVLQTKKLLAA